MFNSGEFKTFAKLFGLALVCFSSSVFAAEELIVPEICVGRAHYLGIFQDSSSTSTTRSKLSVSQAPWQVYNFKGLYDGYTQTLNNVTREIENYKSPLFTYLNNCRKDEKTCHGYFQPTNEFHIQIFCDREILRSSIETIMRIKDARYEKCVSQPFDEMRVDEVQASALEYSPNCFKKENRDGVFYLVNRASSYLKELKWVDTWRIKMMSLTFNTVQKTLIPEGLVFILQKTIEEFQDMDLRKSKINDLNQFYRTGELIREFELCCQNANVNLPSGQLSLSQMGNASADATENIERPTALVFQPQDYLSKMAFDEAERQSWKDLLASKTLRDLSEGERLAYFKYLQNDPLFYFDYEHSFSDLVTDSKSTPRKEFKPKELSPAELKAYQEKFGYVYRTPPSYKLQDFALPKSERLRYDYGDVMFSLGTNDNPLIGNFLFNPDFSDLYMDRLEEGNENAVYEKFENQKRIYYPRIFKSFLPYQFARTAQAKIIRELQKRKKKSVEIILGNFDSFYQWSETLVCTGNQRTYCQPSSKEFRRKKYLKLYEQLITESIPMEYAADETPTQNRKHIYSLEYLNLINQHISSINRYCWEIADGKAYRENPDSFREKLNNLDSRIQDFYSIPRLEELLGQNEFFELLEFDPNSYQGKCITKGFVFGDSGYPSAMGHKMNSPTGYSSGMVPVYAHIDLYDYNIREVFIPSIFKIKKDDLEEVEEEIEEHIRDEFETLNEAFFFDEFEEYKEFLEESSTVRLLALIDYALDNPSAQIGKYLCNLIEISDETEYSAIQRRQMIVNVAMVATTVATVFVLPGAAAGVSVLYEAGTAIVFSAIGIGAASYNIAYYNRKNDLTDMSVLTKNMTGSDGMQLHQYYDEGISNEKISIWTNVGLLVVIGARPIFNSVKYIQKLMDKEFQLVRKTRQLRIEEFIRRSPKQDGFYVTQRMEDFLFDYQKVSQKQFDDFFTAYERGEAEGFIMLNWEKELGRYLPIKPIQPRTFKETWNSLITNARQVPAIRTAFDWMAEKNSVYLSPAWLKTKPYFHDYFLKFFSKNLANEKRIVKMLEDAQALSAKTGREIFSKKEIDLYASKLKHYKYKNGVFQRIIHPEFGKVLDRFMLRSVSGDSYAIRRYLEPLIDGELLAKEEWEIVLKSFNKQIQNIDDAKTFLKTIKYAKKEYSSLGEQFRNIPELANSRELIFTHVYKKRFEIIASHIDEFYDIAKYTRMRNNIRIVDDFKSIIQNHGKSIDELESQLKQRYPDMSIKSMFENYEREKAQVLLFDEAAALETTGNVQEALKRVRQTTRELFKDEDALLRSYKKQFLKQEKVFNDYFHNQFIRALKKEPDVGLAYQRALSRTQIRKSTEYECSLPDSMVRKDANRAYRQLAGKISLTTNFMGYLSVHGQETKDPEWWNRFFYEMTIGYIGGQIQAKIFTSKGAGPLYKLTHDLYSGIPITIFDGALYATLNEGVLQDRSKFQNEFKQIIYEAGDIDATVRDFFEAHPEIEEKILANHQKIQAVFDEIELKNSKGTMVDTEAEDAFVRAGLIDLTLDTDELKNDPIYREMVSNGTLDETLYQKTQSDEETEQQILDLMADIHYQSLYDHKSGKIDYPLMDPIQFQDGDIDSLEIDTGSEALDRMIFYTSYDIVKSPFAYAKNVGVYHLLCKQRFLPNNMNLAAAIALHVVYKATMDPMKWYLREQATGR